VSANPPSARFRQGDPRPIGFQEDPPAAHVDAASEALVDLAETVSRASKPGRDRNELAVCLCSVYYSPGTPFQLYAFHINDIDAEGKFVDPRSEGAEVRLAVVVNHPAEVQVESALGFLFELIERGKAVEAAKANDDLSQIDIQAEASDKRAAAEFLDRMRFGWQEAARRVAQLAGEAGLCLRVRYQRDVFTEREELVRRLPALRTTYNRLDSVRRAVDNIVSMVGGGHPQIRFPGASTQMRELLQSNIAVFGLRHFQNQALRDAEVCGNGYLVSGQGREIAPRCLRPEEVEIVGDGEFIEWSNGKQQPLSNVLHLRGLDQLDSPYGMSVLEPYLFAADQVRVFDESRSLYERVLRDAAAPPQIREEAPRMIELSHRSIDAIEGKLTQLLGYSRDRLPAAKKDLYFPGQEEIH
jgi:hypothetical protein